MTIAASAAGMPTVPKARRGAFIDRDGVINEERGYVHRDEDFVLLPGVAKGLRQLQQAGFALVVVTNQAGIARGLYDEGRFHGISRHMRMLLEREAVRFDGVYFCPHHPEGVVQRYRRLCNCRKPRPGLLWQAAADLGLELAESILVGDKASDIAAGRAAGIARCVLVRSGHEVSPADEQAADACLPDLAAAASWIVGGGPLV